MRTLITRHKTIREAFFTTKSHYDAAKIDGKPIVVLPSSLYCYTIGRNVTKNLSGSMIEDGTIDFSEFIEANEDDNGMRAAE
jgi:hypothetical protein